MEEYISTFLAGKDLAKNSRLAYFYDLQQFVELCQNQFQRLNWPSIKLPSRTARNPVSKKRKQSAVNQFCFLYEEGYLDRFYKLKSSQSNKHTR